jgi:hypothetical protein
MLRCAGSPRLSGRGVKFCSRARGKHALSMVAVEWHALSKDAKGVVRTARPSHPCSGRAAELRAAAALHPRCGADRTPFASLLRACR